MSVFDDNISLMNDELCCLIEGNDRDDRIIGEVMDAYCVDVRVDDIKGLDIN